MGMTIYDANGMQIGIALTQESGNVSIFAGRDTNNITSADYLGYIDRGGYVHDASCHKVGRVNLTNGRIYRPDDPVHETYIAYLDEKGRVWGYADNHGLLSDAGWRGTISSTDGEGKAAAAAAAAGFWFLLGGSAGPAMRRSTSQPSDLERDLGREPDSTGGNSGGGTGGGGGGGGDDIGGLGVLLGIGGLFLIAYLLERFGDVALFIIAAPFFIALVLDCITNADVTAMEDPLSRLKPEYVLKSLTIGFFVFFGVAAIIELFFMFTSCSADHSANMARHEQSEFYVVAISAAFGIVKAIGTYFLEEGKEP